MRACILLFAFLSLPLPGQTIIGTVEKIDKDQIQVKSRDGVVTLHVDEKTKIRKGAIVNDASALKQGDEVRATCYGEDTLTAVNVSARVVFSGVISESSETHIKVIPDATTDEAATMGKGPVFVFLERGAKSAKSSPRLAVGQRVDVIGWDSGDGIVDADHVSISEKSRTVPDSPATRRVT